MTTPATPPATLEEARALFLARFVVITWITFCISLSFTFIWQVWLAVIFLDYSFFFLSLPPIFCYVPSSFSHPCRARRRSGPTSPPPPPGCPSGSCTGSIWSTTA
mmetsp:Transcript_4750/g.14553  ORF Transcript_4750/g.14553 Transcript_4750/m.14553 type:complete len:105 (+) Transcript_4750:1181-1495(+)